MVHNDTSREPRTQTRALVIKITVSPSPFEMVVIVESNIAGPIQSKLYKLKHVYVVS